MTTQPHRWTAEEDRMILAFGTRREVQQGLGLTKGQLTGRNRTLRNRQAKGPIQQAPLAPGGAPGVSRPGCSDEGDQKQRAISIISSTVRTVAQAIEHAEVDLNLWEVERYVINKWDNASKVMTKDGDEAIEQIAVTELWQVKLWLKRKSAACLENIKQGLLDELRGYSPNYRWKPLPRAAGEKYLFEPAIADLHLGKLAWGPETGSDYDSKIARDAFTGALADLCSKAAGFAIDKILLPIGNDLMHIDQIRPQTFNETLQDADTRYRKLFPMACRMLIEAIDQLATIAPVHVLVIPGNHDTQSMFVCGEVLSAWYTARDNDRVVIDNGARLRKYFSYGVNLLGYTHGDLEKFNDLPLVMAQEEPKRWAKAKHKEWHIGHLHRMKESRFIAGDTFNGVRVRVLPSLSGDDAWHYGKGYVKGGRAAEAYLWGYTSGYAGHFSSSAA